MMGEEGAAAFFSPNERDRLHRYRDMLIKWNQKFSFTSIPNGEVFDRLIAPSAWLGKIYSQEEVGRIADFGSGVGIPGLVMALIDSCGEYILIESNGKKAGFMRSVISSFSLGNVHIFDKRFNSSSRIEPVNRIVSRAAGEVAEVLTLFRGKTKEGASADFFKGSDAGDELQTVKTSLPGTVAFCRDVPHWFHALKVVRVENI